MSGGGSSAQAGMEVKLLRGLAEVPSITLVSDASGWWGCGMVPTTMGRPDRAVAHHG